MPLDTSKVTKVENVTFGASSSKAARHDELVGRTLPDQHPISSITGLEEALRNNSSTSTPAVGIESVEQTVVSDADQGENIVTVRLTDGTETEISIKNGSKGSEGEQGENGNGISSVVLNSDYTLTLNFTDGTSYTTPSIRGPQGPSGTGVATSGYVWFNVTEDGYLQCTYTGDEQPNYTINSEGYLILTI